MLKRFLIQVIIAFVFLFGINVNNIFANLSIMFYGEYCVGDTIKIPITLYEEAAIGDTLGGSSDFIWLERFYLDWDIADSAATRIDKFYTGRDSLYKSVWPIRPIALAGQGMNAGIETCGPSYVYIARADYAGKLGHYFIKIMTRLDGLTTKQTKLMYIYNVVSEKSIVDEIVEKILVELKKGVHFSPHGRDYIADANYDKFVDGSNEDPFKATGFSTFDPAIDTVVFVDSIAVNKDKSNYTLTVSEYGHIEDSIYANREDYRAIGFSTFDNTTDSVLIDSTVLSDLFDSLSTEHGEGNWTSVAGAEAAVIADSVLARIGGAGDYPCSLFVYYVSGADSLPLNDARLRITNVATTVTAANWRTDVDGMVVYPLDDGNYNMLPFAVGYSFSGTPYSLVVSGATINDTIYGAPYDIGTPAEPDLCRVHGWVYDAGYVALQGAIVRMKVEQTPFTYDNVILSDYTKTDTTDVDGYWYIDLIPNSLMTPSTTTYRVQIFYMTGTVVDISGIVVPETSTWEFTW